jgi:hypothetical protein
MVRMYRLLIAVFARLILIGLGALLVYGASFYGMILLNRDAREMIGEGGTKMLVLVAAIGTGLAVIGFLLLFFGLRGLWRRIRAGMPSEDEGRAETTTGRLVSAAVFGAGALLGLLRLTVTTYAVGDQIVLAWTGVETNAVIVRKWSGDWSPPGSERPPSAGRQIEFSFQTPDGKTIRREIRISGELYRAVEEGATIPVTYSAKDPTEAETEFASPLAVLMHAFFWIGLISVGLWGVRRNLGSGDPEGGAMRLGRTGTPAPNPPAPPTPSRGSSAGSPVRKQFGQRSV